MVLFNGAKKANQNREGQTVRATLKPVGGGKYVIMRLNGAVLSDEPAMREITQLQSQAKTVDKLGRYLG